MNLISQGISALCNQIMCTEPIDVKRYAHEECRTDLHRMGINCRWKEHDGAKEGLHSSTNHDRGDTGAQGGDGVV